MPWRMRRDQYEKRKGDTTQADGHAGLQPVLRRRLLPCTVGRMILEDAAAGPRGEGGWGGRWTMKESGLGAEGDIFGGTYCVHPPCSRVDVAGSVVLFLDLSGTAVESSLAGCVAASGTPGSGSGSGGQGP